MEEKEEAANIYDPNNKDIKINTFFFGHINYICIIDLSSTWERVYGKLLEKKRLNKSAGNKISTT